MVRVRSLLSWLVLGTVACAGELASEAGADANPASAASTRAPTPSAEPTTRRSPTAPNPPPTIVEAEPTDERPPFDSRWADDVRTIVIAYESWGRVDDESRWAPELCRMPRDARAHISASDDPSTHGHKLYTVYAMDPVAYGAPRSMMGGTAIDGFSQILVKEAFAPVPLDQAQDEKGGGFHPGGGRGVHGLQPAIEDGVPFVAGERRGLYLMMQPEGAPEGTDAGWIYATVEPDMITIGAVGVIASCAGCHAEAGDGRLFGLPGLPSTGPAADARNAPG